VRKPRPTASARGYGHRHQRRRAQLAPLVAAGMTNCARCGQRIQPGEKWHLDHRDDRAGYLGPAHAICNLQAAAAKTNEQRARAREPIPLRWSREWYACDPSTIIDYGGRIVEY
jgi:hypothetical protein